MKDKPDPVLQRLDEWGFNLMRKNYTPLVAQRIQEGVVRATKDIRRESQEDFNFDLEELLKQYEVENMCELAKGVYTQWYAFCEAFLDTGTSEEMGIRLSRGAREEYLDPFKEAVKPFIDFVQSLYDSPIPPREHTDESINLLIKDKFPTLDSYLDFCKRATKASLMLLQIDQDKDSRQLMKFLSRVMDYAIDSYVPAIMKDVYFPENE